MGEEARLRERVRELEARLEAAHASDDHLRFLQAMDRVEAAIRGAASQQAMLRDVLDVVLEVITVDRAWLLFPADPTTPSYQIPMERTRPEYPGAGATGQEIANEPDVADLIRRALNASAPIFLDRAEVEAAMSIAEMFQIRGEILLTLRPPVGQPWFFGAHYCEAEDPQASTLDLQIFEGVGRRLSDALSVWLTLDELRRSEARWRDLIEHAPEAILVLEAAGLSVLDVNPAAEALFGVDRGELIGRALAAMSSCPDDPSANVTAMLRAATTTATVENRPTTLEITCATGDGEETPCEARFSPFPSRDELRVRCTLVDIRERKALEARLRQAQALEAVGLLAGGVAHDFNNLLTVILGSAALLRRQGAGAPVEDIRRAAEQAGALTSQLLHFGRGAVPQPQDLLISDGVVPLERLLTSLVGESRQVVLDLQASGAGRVDPNQLQQVVANLVINARDAVGPGGVIRVETRDVPASSSFDGQPAIRLVVGDRGAGMDQPTLDHIFEPFYTTKVYGTGLGLPTVKRIVGEWGAEIDVESELGVGTTVSIEIPSLSSSLVRTPSQRPSAPVPRATGQRVLLVEDEESTRRVIRGVLEGHGYVVTEAASTVTAKARFDEHQEDFHLVVTDVVLSDGSGIDLARELRALRPALPILCVSGYAPASSIRDAIDEGIVEFLPKPFSPEQFLRRVHPLLCPRDD